MTDTDALARLRVLAPAARPRVAVVLGSGWGGLTDHVHDAIRIPYAELPGFPQATVAGHAGELWLGRLGAVEVAVMSGRKHGYETGAVDGMALPLRCLRALGCEVLVQTNAAGSLQAGMGPGSLMLIADHINLPQRSPLVGEAGSERFVGMADAYDRALRLGARHVATRMGVHLHEGVYLWCFGPQFETPAEIRAFKLLGADAVGMSTVPETILARHAGMRVLALSLITNMAAGLSDEVLSHALTLSAAQAASTRAGSLLAAMIASIPQEVRPMPDKADLLTHARLALRCLDLTSLNDADTAADVARLCARAQSPYGDTAAVCVWPRFAADARRQLPAHIAVAAVANFPDGSADTVRAVSDTVDIVRAGAQEVDVVVPYARLMAGDEAAVTGLLRAVRAACPGLTLKVILETGVLQTEALIRRACVLSIEAGADFLKTSTGKTAVSATPDAARAMLQAIAAHPSAASRVGFKASGGIRTVAEAVTYFSLVADILGPQALGPARLRIGASSLLGDIEAVLGGAGAAASAGPDRY